MSQLVFSVNSAFLEGKQGKLPQEGGYYTMLAGAYGVENSVGDIYAFTKRVNRLFETSTMAKWCDMGQLHGECDHPSLNDFLEKGLSHSEATARWMNRLREVKTANYAWHIRKFWPEELPDKVDGRTVMGVYLELMPLVESLKIQLDTPEANTAASVRSFLHPPQMNQMGQRILEQKDLITYDWVNRPGIYKATKYNTPGLEAELNVLERDSAIITEDVMQEMERLERTAAMNAGNESTAYFDTRMIRNMHGGWQEVENLDRLMSRRW